MRNFSYDHEIPHVQYDIWYLSTTIKDLNWPKIVEAFHEKMKFKGHAFTGFEQFINKDNDKKLKGAWKNRLGHQIPGGKLPEYEWVKSNLGQLFKRHFEE